MDQEKELVRKLSLPDPPLFIVYIHGQSRIYRGQHEGNAMINYIQKQLQTGISILETISAVEDFLSHPMDSTSSTQTRIVGCFSSAYGAEEDEFEDFNEAAGQLQHMVVCGVFILVCISWYE